MTLGHVCRRLPSTADCTEKFQEQNVDRVAKQHTAQAYHWHGLGTCLTGRPALAARTRAPREERGAASVPDSESVPQEARPLLILGLWHARDFPAALLRLPPCGHERQRQCAAARHVLLRGQRGRHRPVRERHGAHVGERSCVRPLRPRARARARAARRACCCPPLARATGCYLGLL